MDGLSKSRQLRAPGQRFQESKKETCGQGTRRVQKRGKKSNIAMNIQDRERDVLKKNLPSALGKIHLLKQPCQDNTELNISLSMLNTFMIQTGKQHRKPISLPPAPRLVLRSQMKAAGSTPGLCSTSLCLGSQRVRKRLEEGLPSSPRKFNFCFSG